MFDEISFGSFQFVDFQLRIESIFHFDFGYDFCQIATEKLQSTILWVTGRQMSIISIERQMYIFSTIAVEVIELIVLFPLLILLDADIV